MSEHVIQEEDFGLLAEHLDLLIQELENDPEAESRTTELLHHTLTLYGEALKRILALIRDTPTGEIVLRQIAADDVISAVLLIHDLSPVDLKTRVIQALDKVRPYLNSHKGDVELLEIEDGVVRLRLDGSCHGCPSSTATLRLGIERAIREAAPDVVDIQVETPNPQTKTVGFVSISQLMRKTETPPKGWIPVTRADEILPGRMKAVDVDGTNILLCNVEGNIYAYRNVCAHKQLVLDKGLLRDSILTCPWHSYQYDVKLAGACLTDATLHLDPFPLIIENGLVKVSI